MVQLTKLLLRRLQEARVSLGFQTAEAETHGGALLVVA